MQMRTGRPETGLIGIRFETGRLRAKITPMLRVDPIGIDWTRVLTSSYSLDELAQVVYTNFPYSSGPIDRVEAETTLLSQIPRQAAICLIGPWVSTEHEYWAFARRGRNFIVLLSSLRHYAHEAGGPQTGTKLRQIMAVPSIRLQLQMARVACPRI